MHNNIVTAGRQTGITGTVGTCIMNSPSPNTELTAISRHADMDIPVPSISFRAYSFGSSLQKERRTISTQNQNSIKTNGSYSLPRASLGAVDMSVRPSPDLHSLKVEQLVDLLPLSRKFLCKVRIHLFSPAETKILEAAILRV